MANLYISARFLCLQGYTHSMHRHTCLVKQGFAFINTSYFLCFYGRWKLLLKLWDIFSQKPSVTNLAWKCFGARNKSQVWLIMMRLQVCVCHIASSATVTGTFKGLKIPLAETRRTEPASEWLDLCFNGLVQHQASVLRPHSNLAWRL